MKAARFFWLCVEHAAKATVEKASAWFWPIGIAIVGIAFWYWKLVPLEIPDHISFPMLFIVETLVVTWFVYFLFHLYGAPGRVWYREVTERKRLAAILEDRKTRLAVKSLLGEVITSGERLLQVSDEQAALAWAENARKLILSAFGNGEAVLFFNSSSYIAYDSPVKEVQIRIWINGRLKRLAELVQRTDTIPIDESFNVDDWVN
jgi:hypothetical protein